MCGILGFNWKDLSLAKDLGQSFDHRGPDMEGYYADDSVSLGHKRLSIIDLSVKGKQPLHNHDKSLFITFNGEIFNYKELKKELPDYEYKTTTDTEVILAAYEKWGVKCLDKLNGQFAFCIYDKNKQKLFLARDRIGINPLYFYHKDKKFIFGSELKVIMNCGIKKKIDKGALHHYLAYGYTPRRQTILENAYKLRPGHYAIYDLKTKTLTEKKYWDVKLTDEIADEKKAAKLIREQLEESVKARLVSDVPVGAFLSGGVDSSAVVAMISKHKKNLNTFSVKFDHSEFDESEHAESIAKKFGTKHHVISFSAKDVKKLMPKLAKHFDEPFSDHSMIPTYLVSQVARKHVTVSLSGDGGDELFGGYTVYRHYRLLQWQKVVPTFVNKLGFFLCKKIPLKILEMPKAFFELGTLQKKFRYAKLMSYLSTDEFKKLTGEDPTKVYSHYLPFSKSHYLNTAINSDLHIYLPDDILTKVDRASLGNSLESRPPILDHKMIELACKISPRLKLRGRTSKYIFKKALEGILPDKILYRKKMGFSVPLKYYLRGELKDLVQKYVFKYDKHKHFSKDFLVELEKKYNRKKWDKDYSRIIWTLMMFNLWWETWM